MANAVDECIEGALKSLMYVTEETKNLRRDLKQKIVIALSDLRKAFSQLNCEVEQGKKDVNSLRDELKNADTRLRHGSNRTSMLPGAPSLQRSARENDIRQMLPSASQTRDYATALGGSLTVGSSKIFKLIVKSKNN